MEMYDGFDRYDPRDGDRDVADNKLLALTVKCRVCDADVGAPCVYSADYWGGITKGPLLENNGGEFHVIRLLDVHRAMRTAP